MNGRIGRDQWDLVSDVNAYKTQIAAAIEAETGRKIVFGGDIAVTLGRTTTLTINDVQLANLPGGSRADMLRVAEATAEVNAWELRRGNIVIQRLELRGVDVLIDIDKKGRTNFDFSSAVSAKSDKRNNDRTGFLLQHIGDVDVRDAKVTIHDARDGLTQRLSLQRFQLSEVTGDDLIRIAAKGRLETNSADMSFDLHGRTGSLAALIARDKRYPVDLRGTVAGMTMAAAGTIADPFAATGLALRIDVSATDLSPVARLLRAELPSAGPARLIASLSGNSETFALDDFSFELGESRLLGDLTFDLSAERFRLDGQILASWLDLSPWLPAIDETEPNRPERLVNNDRIDFTELQKFDANLSIVAETIVAHDLLFRDADLSFAVDNGRLLTSPVHARFDGRAFAADLAINAHPSPPEVSLKLTAQDFDVGQLLGRIFADEFVHGFGGIDLLIEGNGWSLAEIIGSSTGHARILMDAGEVKTGSLDLFVGGISELLPGFTSVRLKIE